MLIELHRLHREISVAAAETPGSDGKDITESLGHRLVEAEQIEASGTPEQVLALAASLVDLLKQVSRAVPARAP